MNKLVKLRLHGDLASIGTEWEFNVNSVGKAIWALNVITDNAFTRYFVENNKLGAKYRVLINGKDFRSPVKELNEKNLDMLNQTQLIHKIENLETIDIVPFIENSDNKIIGIISIVIGVVLLFVPGFQVLGLALIVGGTMLLLARPPEFQNFRNIDKFGNQSYLFGGPTNIIGEGGPVPIGYGRMLVGSQVISSSYTIKDYQTFRDKNP